MVNIGMIKFLKRRRFQAIALIALLALLLLELCLISRAVYHPYFPFLNSVRKKTTDNKLIYDGDPIKAQDKHTILLWRHPHGREQHGIPEGTVTNGCRFTYDRDQLQTASAVFFHYSALDEETMPWKHHRNPDQVFAFYATETPSYVQNEEYRNMRNFDGHFINWTMTYKTDSDVFASYSSVANGVLETGKDGVEKLLQNKRNIALWVVSNCDLLPGSRMRMKYVEDLIQAGLPVHRYGACFNNKEEFGKLPPETLGSYKFYLSFENSLHCEDYMTEKFWKNAIKLGRVPVVWGPSKADVTKLAPSGSFVHAEDFTSPGRLAEYLLYLAKNDTAYREYFNWRLNPSERTKQILSNPEIQTLLCEKLKSGFVRQSYRSISEYYFGGETEECLALNGISLAFAVFRWTAYLVCFVALRYFYKLWS